MKTLFITSLAILSFMVAAGTDRVCGRLDQVRGWGDHGGDYISALRFDEWAPPRADYQFPRDGEKPQEDGKFVVNDKDAVEMIESLIQLPKDIALIDYKYDPDLNVWDLNIFICFYNYLVTEKNKQYYISDIKLMKLKQKGKELYYGAIKNDWQ